MNVLYFGKYKERFVSVFEEIKNLPENSGILELCFGDTYLAELCNKAGYRWKGWDLNEHFVLQARKRGYDAYFGDLTSAESFPKADVCIMMGSLYHFHPHTKKILAKMVEVSNTIIISEPVFNLSSKKGIIGFLAKKSANAGKGHESFRYNRISILKLLEENSALLNYRIVTVREKSKDLIVKLIKNASN